MPTFTKNDFTMHYTLHGEGEPLLCIMGITAPGEYWEDHLECWSNKFHCITPDNRGVGFSDKPAGDYTSEMMAQDHIHLLDHLGIDKVHVVGCSMGSVIAQQIAILQPDRVKSVTLMCTWARCDEMAKSTFNHILQCKANLRSEELLEYLQLLIFDKRSWDDPEFYQTMLEAREDAKVSPFPQPLHGLVGQCAACTSHNTLEQLASITAPTLVIGGETDVFTPRWMAEEVHELIPNSTLHLYPRSGHAFHWENLEDFNQRVADFVTANV